MFAIFSGSFEDMGPIKLFFYIRLKTGDLTVLFLI